MSRARVTHLVATEHQEQVTVVQWAERRARNEPRLDLLFAIPNGGDRHPAVAGKLRAEGVRPGVPDLCLPCPVAGYFGLYIELKRRQRGRTSSEQEWWIAQLRCQGYRVVVARGADEAITAIVEYLGMEEAA